MKSYLEQICYELAFPGEAMQAMTLAWDAIANCPEARALWYRQLAAYDLAAIPGIDGVSSGAALPSSGAAGHGATGSSGSGAMDFEAAIRAAEQAASLTGVHPYTAQLLLFLCFTRRLRELYLERRLPLQIWRDSCMDLRWKLLECRRVYGIWGSFVSWWFPGFFALTRFALGRLQFELADFPAGYAQAGRVPPEGIGEAINIHIPSSGKLTREDCSASFRQAAGFFERRLPGDCVAFRCDSWLLFLPHRTFLAPDSGIVGFMDWFDIYAQEDGGDQDLWRVFDRMDLSDPAALPARTSLQRGYRERLLSGKRNGFGRGVFFYSRSADRFSKDAEGAGVC